MENERIDSAVAQSAERTLRLAVTKRKVSGGSRSMEQFQDTANLLTVIQKKSSSKTFCH